MVKIDFCAMLTILKMTKSTVKLAMREARMEENRIQSFCGKS
jgi:hypothetical protein